MVRNLLNRLRSTKALVIAQKGFTLIELLVVILIIGILIAVAASSFLGQTSKGYDAGAKQMDDNVNQAAQIYYTDNSGTYVGMTLATLTAEDPAVQSNSTVGVVLSNITPTGYTVTSTASSSGDTFTLINAAGTVTRTCLPAGSNKGGCPNSAAW
jgi:prepilin-type N-terminal cleavage/methylation domain-containing protein